MRLRFLIEEKRARLGQLYFLLVYFSQVYFAQPVRRSFLYETDLAGLEAENGRAISVNRNRVRAGDKQAFLPHVRSGSAGRTVVIMATIRSAKLPPVSHGKGYAF